MDVEEMSKIFFTNLQLLGMDTINMEGKYKIPFNKDMFNLPNKAGSEAVLHFLFTRLNPSLSQEQFRDCWPVIDRKTELHFRKVCNNWLTCIQKDEADAHMPQVNAALLLSPGGRKYIHLLYSFSTYVLVQVMKSDHGWKAQESLIYPTVHPSTAALDEVMAMAIQDGCLQQRDQFFQHLHVIVTANRKWREYTDELIKSYRGLVKAHRDIENEKRQEVNITAENALRQGVSLPPKRTLTLFDADRDVYATKRGQRLERTRAQWRALSKFNDTMKEAREIVQSVLDNRTSKFKVDGTDMGVRVPGLLLRECRKEIHQREIDNVYSGGRLNLVSVVLLWNICLNLYKNQIESEEFPEVSSEIPDLSTQAHKHHSHLMSTQELREEMRNRTVPRLQHSVSEMQKRLNKRVALEAKTPTNNNLKLVLSGPTPTETTIDADVGDTRDTPAGPLAGKLSSDVTPDAMMIVADKIEKAVHKETVPSVSLLDNFKFPKRLATDHSVSSSSSKSSVTEENKKQTKPKTSTSVSHRVKSNASSTKPDKKGMGSKHSASVSKTSHIPQSHGKLLSHSKHASETPRTSKNKAFDILADTIVDSVIEPSYDELMDLVTDRLSPHGELDLDAFVTKNLIARSPVDSPSTVKGSEKSHAFAGARPKTFTGSKTSEAGVYDRDQFSSGAISPTQRESEISFHSVDMEENYESFLSQLDKDRSNNASVNDSSRSVRVKKSKQNVSHNTKATQHLETGLLKSPRTHAETPLTHTVKARTVHSHFTSEMGSKERHNSSLLEQPENEQTLQEWSQMFDNSDRLLRSSDKRKENSPLNSSTSLVHLSGAGGKDGSFSFRDSGRSPNIMNTSRRHEPSSQTLYKSSAGHSNTQHANGVKDSSLQSRSVPLDGESVGDLLDRPPGDGEASTEPVGMPTKSLLSKQNILDQDDQLLNLGISPLHSPAQRLKDNTKRKENSKVGSPVWKEKSASPFTSGQKSTNTVRDLPFLPSPAHFMGNESGKKEMLIAGSPVLRGGTASPLHTRDLNSSGDRSYFTTAPSKNDDLLDSSHEDLLTFGANKVPNLIDLGSDDGDMESEQDFNDSFAPFKQGICLDSRTPTKSTSYTLVGSSPGFNRSASSHNKQSHLNLSGTTPTATRSSAYLVPNPSADSIQAKLSALQQKVTEILDTSMENLETSAASQSESQQGKAQNLNQGDRARDLNHGGDDDDDDDLMNTQLINTDLVGGIDDLLL